jgi:tripartite-type tricarboxylate transporter receptor subunit TctC
MYMAKIELVHIPFRGSAPAITALLGGQIGIARFASRHQGLIEAGRSNCWVSPARRLKAFRMPTIAETLPGFEATWMGVVAPPGTRRYAENIGRDWKGVPQPEVRGLHARCRAARNDA